MYVWAAAVAGVLFAVFIIAFTWYISGAFLRPPFLTHNPGKKLAVVGHGIHPAWGTHIHDPLVDFGLQFKDVEFRAGGDVPHTCRGWLIDRRGTPNARRVAVVFVHGGGRDRRAFLRHSSWVCREGYSALLYDSRGHGVSDGKAGLSFGLHEHEDAMAAVRFMRTQGFDRVVMIGTSIGAVSCLLAAHHLKQAVVGVVAENPFTTIQANVDGLVHKIAFQRVLLRQNKPLMWLCSPVRRTVARLTIWRIMRLLGPNATRRDVHAINIMAGLAPRPVLLMHGTEDRLIDHQHTVELAEQASDDHTDVWLAEGADHTVLYDKYPVEFRTRVLRLLERAGKYALQLDRDGSTASGTPQVASGASEVEGTKGSDSGDDTSGGEEPVDAAPATARVRRSGRATTPSMRRRRAES